MNRHKLGSEVAIHNFYSPTTVDKKPLPYKTFVFPTRGYTGRSTLQHWQWTRYLCHFTADGVPRDAPIPVCVATTDSAPYHLSAAKTIMTPQAPLIKAGMSHMALRLSDEKYIVGYLGKYPMLYFPDYEHVLRLLLRCLKYEARHLVLYSHGDDVCVASIDHLHSLRNKVTKEDGLTLSLHDLILIKYHDQNTNAAEKVFSDKICDQLQNHVSGSEGTIVYIKAVCFLLKPCRSTNMSYKEAMTSVTTGLYMFRLWRKYLQASKFNLHAKPGAKQNQAKRGHFITGPAYDAVELTYSGVVGYLLTLFRHFKKKLSDPNLFPLNLGTGTTERIISEIQGQTTHSQHLDKQPTYADILHRLRGVEENQRILEELTEKGVKQRISNKRRELKRKRAVLSELTYEVPNTFEEFVAELVTCHDIGVKQAQDIMESYLPKGFPERLKSIIDRDNRSAWDLPYSFAHPPDIRFIDPTIEKDHPFVKVNFDTIKIVKKEEEEEEEEEEDTQQKQSEETCQAEGEEEDEEEVKTKDSISGHTHDNSQNPADTGCTEGNDAETSSNDNKNLWYFSKLEDGEIKKYHIKTILNELCQKEDVDRSRAGRHKKYPMPGCEIIPKDHDVILFHDYVVRDTLSKLLIVNITRIEGNGGKRKKSCSSKSDHKFMGRIYTYFNKEVEEDTMLFSKMSRVQNIVCEIELNKTGHNVWELSQPSLDILQEKGVSLAVFGVYFNENKKRTKTKPKNTSGDTSDSDYYELETVEGVRINAKDHYSECLVKFKGYDKCEWVPENSLKAPIQINVEQQTGRSRKVILGAKAGDDMSRLIVQKETVPAGNVRTKKDPEKRRLEKESENMSQDERHAKRRKCEEAQNTLGRCSVPLARWQEHPEETGDPATFL